MSPSAGMTSGGSQSTGGSMSGEGGEDTGAGGEMQGPPKGGFGCPEAKPEEAAECTRQSSSACVYEDGGCVCVEGAWDCYADADCPASAPADAAECTLGGMACSYEGLNCTCSTTNGWTCQSPCPEMTPADAATCRRPAENTCRYDEEGALVQGGFGDSATTCSCDAGAFSCFSDADCPSTAPENASACDLPTLSCSYEDRECSCEDGAWSCEIDCPDMEPADGTACLRPANATCRYLEGAPVQGFGGKSDATCRCEDEVFTCFGAEDCPATAPTTGSACEFPSLSCAYTGSECDCGGNGMWSCETECPATVPAQDTACERSENQTCRYNGGMLVQGGGFGSAEAVCACRDQAFDCLTDANCPETKPAAQSECAGLSGLACVYEDERCSCGQGGWTCQTPCPSAPPAAGTACNRPATSTCAYAAGALVSGGAESDSACVCSESMFTCYTAADCPAAAPTSGSTCAQPGLRCEFDAQACWCSATNNTWFCPGAPGGEGGAGG